MTDKKVLRLLLVEDSDNDAQLLLRELERGPYQVVYERADSAVRLQALLEQGPWDIVVCDYSMPQFTALDALAIVRKNSLDLPFIVVSGTIGEETAVEVMKAGAHDYLMKDKLLRLRPAVEREIREAAMRRQRAQSELALYESEEKFRFMFEHNPVPMWVVDGQTGIFLEVNEAAVSHYGYSRGEFLRMKAPDLLAPTDGAPPEIETKRSVYLGHRMVTEEKHKLKNGELTEVEIHSDIVMLGDKKLVLIIAQDISRRKQTERELILAREAALETARLKSEFLANVSHEIRTPLNGVIGMTGILLKTPLSPKQKEYGQIVKQSGDSLLAIVNDILDFSKTESGKLELEMLEFNLSEIIDLTVQMLSSKAKQKKLKLTSEIAPGVPLELEGDSSRLQQILINLIDNAVKFTDRGEVSVAVKMNGEESAEKVTIKFSVKDQGIGISEQARDRLFNPFSQVDSSSTRRHGGTGLGLAICKQLVELMGGEIDFESKPGEGSTFWFTAPLKINENRRRSESGFQSNGPSTKKTKKSSSRPTSGRILVVEDNAINQQVTIKMLKELGYESHGVEDGKKAVEEIDRKNYSVVLMDCQMPVMDGYQATALIREKEKVKGKRTPIIAVTAHVMKGDREKCLKAGMDDYLPKPVDANQLATTLKKWIQSH